MSRIGIVISRYETYNIYGINVEYDKENNIYTAFIGGKKYQKNTFGDMVYTIQNLRSGIGVIH